ncbi:DUF3054 domain-containing protein [Agromyces sp. GXQ0307]|uniref:DUF3054 domain-containing protein n=1 Tax=Agromyces sp. GXQ0307 TaxID=3377835 RepID=UPI003839D784
MAATASVPRVTAILAGALDVMLVVLFAGIGRASHGEVVDAGGVWETAWPFLVGLAVGWLLVRGWRRPLAVRPTGVAAWVAAVAVGMLLRLATGGGAALAFVVVATATLGLFLLGWRAIAVLIRRARRARSTARNDGAVES